MGVKADHAWRRAEVDLETILNAPMINDPLTKYMFCSPAEGGVALILASERKMRELGADGVKIANILGAKPATAQLELAPAGDQRDRRRQADRTGFEGGI